MRRWLFNLATAVSLGLCVATIALWVASYFSFGWIRWTQNGETWRMLCATSHRGVIIVSWLSGNTDEWTLPFPPPRVSTGFGRKSIDMPTGSEYVSDDYRGVGFDLGPGFVDLPHWFFVVLFAITPFCALARKAKSRRRVSAGRCVRCGYDLRATPQRCPECGAVPPVRSAQRAEPDQRAQPLESP